MAEGAARYCGQCGQPVGEVLSADGISAERVSVNSGEHPACIARANLEPPRFCPQCARRMVVQVEPMGWRAVCSRHGQLRG